MSVDKDEEEFRCKWNCGATFSTIKEAQTHQEIHRTIKEYICRYCNNKYTFKRERDQHLLICDKNVNKEFDKALKERRVKKRKNKQKYIVLIQKK